MKYRLRRDSAMYKLWNALPYDQWVSAKEVNRLAPTSVANVSGALSALVARNLVQRRPSRSNLNAYDYLRLHESESVETPDTPPDGSLRPVAPPERQAREVGGEEPFAPPISGGDDEPSALFMAALKPAPHGTARCYMAGCGDPRCERAYNETRKVLGL